ncbi:MAG: hypothetical protein KGL39_18270 [Patescibacteria group bacterium]|nr:hypothetical protein [Patescibacteria group bacterium]
MMKILNNREGQLLVESVIAIGIFTIAIVGIVGVIARAVHEGRTVGNQFIAADLAAEGVEVTKNILDSNALNSGGSTGGAWNAGVQQGIYEVDYTSTSTGPDIGSSLTNLNSASSTYNQLTTLYLNDLGAYQYTKTSTSTIYRRYVQVEYIPNTGDNQIRAISTVIWPTSARAGGYGIVSVATDFLNWR